jgi:hypothetical protein
MILAVVLLELLARVEVRAAGFAVVFVGMSHILLR